jgi:hypothetical protein
MVGDGHAMGISAEILEHVVGTAEGWFGVDDPVFSEQRSEPGSEDLGLREQSQIAGEVQLVTLKSGLESGDELAAKHASEYLDGEKEARAGSDPASVIEREPAGRDDTVYVGMKLEFLVPSVEHAEEADLGTEMSWVASDLEKSFRAGTKQQTIDYLLVLQSQRRQLGWQSEHDMNIGRGQKFTAPGLDPAFAGAGLTLRTVPIATAVVRDGGTMSATGAFIDMTAECGGATARDGQQDLDMGPADPRSVALDESTSCSAN